MSSEILVEDRGEYLLVTLTGPALKPKEAEALLVELGERAKVARRHLMIYRPDAVRQKISSIDLFHLAGVLEKIDFGGRLGMVFPEAQRDNLTFFEDEAKKRGLLVRVFDKLASAESWIAESD